jgi:hypothetical protein
MKLQYSTSVADWLASQTQAISSPAFREAVTVRRYVLAIGLGLVAAWGMADISGVAGMVCGIVVAGTVYLGYPQLVRSRYLRSARARFSAKDALPFFSGERTIEVTKEGLLMESPAGRQFVRWAFVKQIHETPGHVFVQFFYGLSAPIPKAKLDTGDTEAFVRMVADGIATAEPRVAGASHERRS